LAPTAAEGKDLKVLVTGASGFIGHRLCKALSDRQDEVVRATRAGVSEGVVVVENIGPQTDWRLSLATGFEVVIHLAARVHVMNDADIDPLQSFSRVNVGGTLNLARQSAAAGVKRFIYLSSIKVNGEATLPGKPFTAEDVPHPEDAYAISKAETEAGLREIAHETGLEVVIIRPPLVYGPGVKGNFQTLIRWLARGLPFPLGAVTNNRRSMVALDNLIDLIVICMGHPKAANQTFLVCDGDDLSTADLLRRLGHLMDRPVLLLHIPVVLLKFMSHLVRRSEVCDRLCGSLQVDMSKTRELLEWSPPVGVDQGLKATVEGLSF
jgi:nucleoside-diphosphate-sugar epimerase